MTTILNRLYNIAKAYRSGIPGLSSLFSNEKGTDASGKAENLKSESFFRSDSYSKAGCNNDFDYPGQVMEDLASFNLAPPSSLSEVRKARNREIKKYHPDRFMDDPERRKTAGEIMQIYNSAYDRLKTFYQDQTGENK